MDNNTVINLFENIFNSLESGIMNYEDAKHNYELFKQMGIDCDIKDFLGKRVPRVDEIAMCN